MFRYCHAHIWSSGCSKIDAVAPISTTRRVRFESEDLDAIPMGRRTDAAHIAAGSLVEVQIGARWVTNANGRQELTGGHWVRCEVLSETTKEVVVRLLV